MSRSFCRSSHLVHVVDIFTEPPNIKDEHLLAVEDLRKRDTESILYIHRARKEEIVTTGKQSCIDTFSQVESQASHAGLFMQVIPDHPGR